MLDESGGLSTLCSIMTNSANPTTCILGGAQTDFARNWTREGADFVKILNEVVEQGLANLELDGDEIRRLNQANRIGVFVGNFNGERFMNQGHLGAFLTEANPAFNGVPGARYEAACASGSVAMDAARAKIEAGDYDLCLVVGIEVMKTVNPSIGNDYLGYAAHYENEARGVRFVFPRIFGKLTDEIIERQSGIGEERIMDCLKEISRINFTNARNNPLAQTREHDLGQLESLDKKYGKSFGGRTRYSDCSQITDGAVLVALASPDYARQYAAHRNREQNSLAHIRGWGHVVAPLGVEEKLAYGRTTDYIVPFTRKAVEDALNRAGLSESEIDVIETHDCFTSSEYLAVSAFGLTPPGEEWRAVEEGNLQKSGKTPINPSGGLIGAGHPVGATGARMMLDLYKQVTKQAGAYQVEGARRGAMLNIGGSFTTNMSFIVEGMG